MFQLSGLYYRLYMGCQLLGVLYKAVTTYLYPEMAADAEISS